jgi:hypothetical protein
LYLIDLTIEYKLSPSRLSARDHSGKTKREFTDKNGVEMYMRAIQWGGEDLYDATSFVLKHAEQWNIDKGNITICGSSAGATNSLVAEYGISNQSELASKHLPKGFNYAGVIAMAGAFWLEGVNTPLTWGNPPCPILFSMDQKTSLLLMMKYIRVFPDTAQLMYINSLPKKGTPTGFLMQ